MSMISVPGVGIIVKVLAKLLSIKAFVKDVSKIYLQAMAKGEFMRKDFFNE